MVHHVHVSSHHGATFTRASAIAFAVLCAGSTGCSAARAAEVLAVHEP